MQIIEDAVSSATNFTEYLYCFWQQAQALHQITTKSNSTVALTFAEDVE